MVCAQVKLELYLGTYLGTHCYVIKGNLVVTNKHMGEKFNVLTTEASEKRGRAHEIVPRGTRNKAPLTAMPNC